MSDNRIDPNIFCKYRYYKESLFYSHTVYSPDPYVTVQALGTPNGVKRTQHVKDSSDPEWGETLQFFVDPERDRVLGERLIKFGL